MKEHFKFTLAKYCKLFYDNNKDLKCISWKGVHMKQVLIAGTNELARYYVNIVHHYANMKIIAILQTELINEDISWTEIPIVIDTSKVQMDQVDHILWCAGEKELVQFRELRHYRSKIIMEPQLQLLKPFVENFIEKFRNTELILNSIRDGLIVVDQDAHIQFMNQTARDMLQVHWDTQSKRLINEFISNSGLPRVLQHQEKVINEQLTLENGKKIITTRIPLIDDKQHLIGAFAIFKDSHEILRLAEENTDLKEIKAMLEAIIQSSDEPISVVDEDGNGLMINPAYTRITGLSKREVIGKPATVDISEGESMHMQVLKTRRSIRGARMKVGPKKNEVLVNASPVLVHGKLKGSVAVIHDISEITQLTIALKQAKQMIRDLEETNTFDDIIGNSSEMMIAVEQAKIGARTSATVLLRGATGTGKELFAQAIHHDSERKYHKFIRVNCAAYEGSSLEKLLFGSDKNAHDEAESTGEKGLFEEANKGSIFLDEISALSLQMQAKLLRVLDEKKVYRIGSTISIPLDIKIITATNANLEKAITEKTFREDLYYKLNTLPIHIPSLEKRSSDLTDLVDHIIWKVNQLYGRNVLAVSANALEKMHHYSWPGNVRELENVISRAVIFMDINEEIIDVQHLPVLTDKQTMKDQTTVNLHQTLQQATDAFERDFILQVYEANHYNKTKTAEALNISVRNLYYKLEKYET